MRTNMATIKKVENKKGISYKIGFMHPETKKWTTKKIKCSYKDALRIKADIETDIAYGRFGKSNSKQRQYFWSQLKNRYIIYSKRNKSEKTVVREKLVFKTFEKFLDKDCSLKEITNRTIERYKEKRLDTEISPATVTLDLRVLKATFNQAIKWGIVDKNPVYGVKFPKAGIIKVRFLRKSEIDRLKEAIIKEGNTDFLDLVVSYLGTGTRRIELLYPQLTWDDVDFEERKIIINGKGKRKRYIPMNKQVFDIFNRRFNNEAEHPFTFKPDFVSHKIAYYYKLADIKGANLHSLRKTFGSLLLQNRIADLFLVSKLLGHSSVSTTEKYYVDFLDENYRSSVNGLDDLI